MHAGHTCDVRRGADLRSGKWCLPYARGHGGPRRPRSGCGRVPPPPVPRPRCARAARRLRMPVIRPVCLDLDEEYRDDDHDTAAAGSVETRVTTTSWTTWTRGMTSGAETCHERVSRVRGSQAC